MIGMIDPRNQSYKLDKQCPIYKKSKITQSEVWVVWLSKNLFTSSKVNPIKCVCLEFSNWCVVSILILYQSKFVTIMKHQRIEDKMCLFRTKFIL